MGISICNFTYSDKLEAKIRELETKRLDPSEACDLTSTSGYDNDGSTGPELVDNGVGLGLFTASYGKDAKIFIAENDRNTTFYVVGFDEDDAVRRVIEEEDKCDQLDEDDDEE